MKKLIHWIMNDIPAYYVLVFLVGVFIGFIGVAL